MSLNVGILGHVDCGKTTLTRIMADMASTSAFDKHADKGGRRNTLDLGFSSVTVDGRRLALVDCPGHAALIKAVLAASSVFDMAIVVVDASCGVQPQTAEHLLLCSIFCPERVIVALNKTDLIEPKEIAPITLKVRKALKSVGVLDSSPIVSLSLLNPTESTLDPLFDAIRATLYKPERINTGKMLLAVDHCFFIKGKGTVLTGTVVDGSIKLNQEIEIPTLKEKRKVKGLESWKEQVDEVVQGERAAVLVQQLAAESISRTMVCAPSTLTEVQHWLCSVSPIAFYRATVSSGLRIHVSTGFETVMAECSFMRPSEDDSKGRKFEHLPSMGAPCVALVSFDKPVFARPGSFYIASKLDHQGKGCRFAFHGQLDEPLADAANLRRFVRKIRRGLVQRVENSRSIICESLFKKETKMSLFEGMIVTLSTGEAGRVESSFGKSGKARIVFSTPIADSTLAMIEKREKIEVILCMRKYLGDKSIESYVPTEEELKLMTET